MSRLSEAKVGAIMVVALLILAAVGYYILGPGRAGKTWSMEVIFENARGLTGGEPVRMAGVQIGIVDEVALAGKGRASVKLLIQEGVPLYREYIFSISRGALVPERYVDVEPVEPGDGLEELGEGSVVNGLESPGLPEIMDAAYVVLTQLQETAASVNSLVGDPATSEAVKQSIIEFEKTASRAAAVMANLQRLSAESRPHLAKAAREIAAAGEEARATVAYLSARIQDSPAPDQLETAIASINRTAQSAEEAAVALNALLADEALQQDIRATLSNTRQMSENLKEASADIKTVTGDLRESSPKIKSLISSAESVAGDVEEWKERLQPPEADPSFDFLHSPRAERSITDVRFDLSFAGQEDRFLRLGAADVGEQNQADIQAGRRYGNKTLRYGLVRSKLGVGADLEIDEGQLSLDVLDPNRLRADFTVEYPVGGEEATWGLILGVRDAFGDDLGFVGARFGK